MRNLSEKGLSMSQAQSISNLCNQKCTEIANKIDSINNSSSVVNVGVNDKGLPMSQILDKAIQIPSDIVALLKEKSRLHACQAFLMTSITSKTDELNRIKNSRFNSEIEFPVEPEYVNNSMLKDVDEKWAWSTLSDDEYNKYLEAEAYAAHIGQFIHSGGKLDKLRKELPTIAGVKWMEIETGKKTPIIITTHHTHEQLYTIHEELANLHREYEQIVNYYKSKVKNIITEENARIAKENSKTVEENNTTNSKLRNDYMALYDSYLDKVKKQKYEFEEKRHADTKAVANLRINVDKRFQDVIDLFITKEQ